MAKMSKRAAEFTALIEEGRLEDVLYEGIKSNANARALREAGFTLYGTQVREECKCWFYERAPWQHDCFLDLPDLPISVAASLLIRLTFLDGHQGTFDPPPLFQVPEEIKTFASIHDMDLGWDTARLMARLAEQARWGRLSGRKMAMVDGVPGLDPDYVPCDERQVAEAAS